MSLRAELCSLAENVSACGAAGARQGMSLRAELCSLAGNASVCGAAGVRQTWQLKEFNTTCILE